METNEIPFSIPDYQKLVVEDQTHELTVTNIHEGSVVNVVTTESGNDQFPVLTMYGKPGVMSPVSWRNNGQAKFGENLLMLKEKAPKVLYYINLYHNQLGPDVDSIETANSMAATGRIGVLKITNRMIAEAVREYEAEKTKQP